MEIKKLLCKIGWHFPSKKRNFDGFQNHSICKNCGKELLQDSQGGWF